LLCQKRNGPQTDDGLQLSDDICLVSSAAFRLGVSPDGRVPDPSEVDDLEPAPSGNASTTSTNCRTPGVVTSDNDHLEDSKITDCYVIEFTSTYATRL